MAQQQQQSKLGSMKPTKIDSSIRNAKGEPTGMKSIGKGWGGEAPIKKAKVLKGGKKVNPSYNKIEKSIKKTMGY